MQSGEQDSFTECSCAASWLQGGMTCCTSIFLHWGWSSLELQGLLTSTVWRNNCSSFNACGQILLFIYLTVTLSGIHSYILSLWMFVQDIGATKSRSNVLKSFFFSICIGFSFNKFIEFIWDKVTVQVNLHVHTWDYRAGPGFPSVVPGRLSGA